MFVVLGCALLLITGCALGWRWRHSTLALPHWAVANPRNFKTSARALLWLSGIALLSGLLVGVLIVGPGGRLVMRLLALTSPTARGALTEGQDVVGDISVGGTIGVFIFGGLPFGLVGGTAYALVSFVLPRAAAGGAIFGAAMLVVLGSRVGPLREENLDFDILGPGWLSITAFGAMALVSGIVTAAMAGRIGAALVAPRAWWALWMVPAGLITLTVLVSVPVAFVAVLIGCLVFLGAVFITPSKNGRFRHRARLAIQAVLAASVAIALPGFLAALASIAG